MDPLVSKATALPTVPQPVYLNLFSEALWFVLNVDQRPVYF